MNNLDKSPNGFRREMKTRILVFILLLTQITLAESFKFGVIGDAGLWNANTQSVQRSMINRQVNLLIMPGDNLYKGTYKEAWAPWINKNFEFSIVAIGNHNDGYQNEISFFRMPAEYYSKYFGQSEFLVLNSDNSRNVDEQISWLEEKLSTSQSLHTFIVYHHPSLTIGSHKWTEKRQFQIKIRNLFKKYRNKITAVLVGHDHVAGLIHFDDLPIIVSGSVQSPDKSQAVNNTQEGIIVKTEILFSAAPYWVEQTIDDNSEFVIFDFIRANDSKLLCTAKIKKGQKASYNCTN